MIARERNNILLTLLTGVLVPLCCLGSFNIPYACFVAYVPLFFVLEDTECFWKMLFYSWLAMFVQTLIGFQWIHFVATEFGQLPGWIAFFVLIAFALFTTFSLQIFAVLYYWVGKWTKWNKGYRYYFLVIPSLFALSEVLDPKIFNWHIGDILSSFKYLPQFADFFGVSGLSFFVILINVAVFLIIKYLIEHKRWDTKAFTPSLVVIIGVFTFLTVYGYYSFKNVERMEDKCPKVKAGVIQANIGTSDQLEFNHAAKLRTELAATDQTSNQLLVLRKYEAMSRKTVADNPGIDLIVWPETAFPGYYIDRNPDMVEHRKMVQELGIPFLIGGYYIDVPTGFYYNSAILVYKDEIELYHKKILLPFGEFMPLGETFPFLKNLVPSVGDFSRGAGATTLNLIINGIEVRFAPTICYEILKTNYVRQMVNKDAHIFLNLSNDSWFGKVEPYQHLALTRIRAIEFRRPIIRSTNTGITTMIDMNGMLVKKGTLDREEIFVFDAPVCDHRIRTFYSVAGYLFPWFLALLVGILVFYLRKKTNIKSNSVKSAQKKRISKGPLHRRISSLK